MQRLQLLLVSVLLFIPALSHAQTYGYTHYDIGDGLAGSTVYCITQDGDGFIWTGTETGVSRFDGTHFKNFTAEDGLPDVEVLNMFSDSKGKVWMAPFSHSVCYYFKGRIHNQENDSVLRKVKLNGNISHFAEDRQGNILVQERSALHLVYNDGRVKDYDSKADSRLLTIDAISYSPSGFFQVLANDTLYELEENGLKPLSSFAFHPTFPASGRVLSGQILVGIDRQSKTAIRVLATGKTNQLSEVPRLVNYNIIADSLVYINESTGTTEFNIHSGNSKKFLPGMEVSCVFRDVDGNTWFSTIGQGLFRLNSDEFRSLSLKVRGLADCSVHSIYRTGSQLILGVSQHAVFRFRLPNMEEDSHQFLGGDWKARITYICQATGGAMVYGSDEDIEKWSFRPYRYTHFPVSVKSAFRTGENEFLFVNSLGGFRAKIDPLQMVDTFWTGRCTTVYFRQDTTYVGTLHGLYVLLKDKSVVYAGDNIPFLRKRIASIAGSADGTLWIACYDGGVIGYRYGKVIITLTHDRGLTSNICRTLTIQDHYLWVGTDRGLNKVDLADPSYPVIRYTSNDGLGSDIINTVYADSPTIYVGTSAGLSFFEERVHPGERCRLILLKVVSGNRDRISDTGRLVLPYTSNNVRFDYAGISYRSAGNITYRYRLTGLDTAWRQTKETFLEYPSLPSGDYAWELTAINKFGAASRPLSVKFSITTPFWKTWWFIVILAFAFLLATWGLVDRRIRRAQLQQEEKERLNRKMNELENMALQAQMNPHFIFNCLNTVQQFIFDQDTFLANQYISDLATLIRATLHYSNKPFITVRQEIDYLNTYLSIEKVRFNSKMDYRLEVDESVDKDELQIPPMLIQPYVENGIRHGLRHKKTGKGLITVSIRMLEDSLQVIVEDNGIGREMSARYKTREHIEYQSRGMSLTADRIRMLNSINRQQIHVWVEDLRDAAEGALGTRIILMFPLFHDIEKT
jgi:ligand-binding sensor domain-containing protein